MMLMRVASLALIALVAAVAMTGRGAAAREPGTPEPLSPVPAQYYELSGPGLTITIDAPAIADVLPTLHIEYASASDSGSGSEEASAASPEVFTYDGPPAQMQAFPGPGGNGWLLTVMVEAMPDARTVTLSVLMPLVNLAGEPASIDTIDTFAILTTHPTSIGGPALVTGPLQLYQVIPLSGTVRQSGL